MSINSLVLNAIYYSVLLGYPAYKVYMSKKENKVDRLWIFYFFVLGIFTILESTLLWPVKYIFSLVCGCAWCYVKFFFALWLQHPSYKGALYLNQIGGQWLDLAYAKSSPITGKVLNILGVPDRHAEEKTQ